MRIAIVSPSLELGGAERIVVTLARGLADRGHDVTVASAPGPLGDELSGIQRVALVGGGRSPAGNARSVARLARALRRRPADVVHAHNTRMTCVAAIAGALAAGHRGRPLVATFHGHKPAEQPLAGHLLRHAARAVVCVSDELATALARAGVPAERCSVIHNGVEPARPLGPEQRRALDTALGLGTGPVVAAVGRLVDQKNHARFLEAAAAVLSREPAAHFLLVGDGPLRAQLEARADALGIRGNVHFTGARPDARALIARADLVVFSSDWEGLSVAALEALAAGTPVVSTPVEGMRTLLASGAGTLVGSYAAASLADTITALLADAPRRHAMAERGRRLVADSFGVEAMLDAYEACYAAVLEDG